MSIYLAFTGSETVQEDLPGPWRAVHRPADGMLLVDSDETLSRVYHELKCCLPDAAPLLVSEVAGTPKLRGLAPGTQTWLRRRTS